MANKYAEKVKEDKFGEECKAAGVVLVPMVVETFGAWDTRADEVFAFISKGSGARANEAAPRATSFLRRSLSVCLQRSNVRTLLGRVDPNCPALEEPFEAVEAVGDEPFVDEIRELLLAGCACVAGRECTC